MSDLLKFDQIAAADDLKSETVDVPEWGGSMRLRELTVGEKLALSALAGSEPHRVPAWLVAQAAINDKGAPLHRDKAVMEAVIATKGDAVRRLSEVVVRLSGLDARPDGDAEKN